MPALVLAVGLVGTAGTSWWWTARRHHAFETALDEAADRATRIVQHAVAHATDALRHEPIEEHLPDIAAARLLGVGEVEPVDGDLGRVTKVVVAPPANARLVEGRAVPLRPGVVVQDRDVFLVTPVGERWRVGRLDIDTVLVEAARAHHRIDLALWDGDRTLGGRWVAGPSRGGDGDGDGQAVWHPVPGSNVVLEVSARPGFLPTGAPTGPSVPAVAGLLLTVFAAGLARSRVLLDDRAARLAGERTAALQMSSSDAWLLADGAPVGIFCVDESSRLTYANERAEEIVGRELTGTEPPDWVALVHPDDRPRVAGEWTDAPQAREYATELRIRLPDGRVRWVRVRAATLLGPDGGRRGMVGTLEDLTDVVRSNARAGRQLLQDPLTGLANRPQFLRHLDALLAAGEPGTPAAGVVYLDVDDLKVLNDSLGHASGDDVLVELARRLRALCEGTPFVPARFGGDEFAVLCEEVYDDTSLVAAAELVHSVFEDPFVIDAREVLVTASMGLALAPAGSRAGEVLQDADAAMYRAKDTSRGGWVVFDAAMRAGALERLEMVQALWRAVDREEMVLHYQPKVSLLDGSLVGFEALVRWEHPERGLLAPERFVALAEETGLIVPLGRWVLQEACRQAAAWAAGEGGAALTMAVNISAAQFATPDLAGEVAAILEETGLDPALLCLEITESVLMADPEQAVATLHDLKELGVQLAVDDFGTGYSSLGSLRRFPVDQLKIDRSFVAGVGTNPDDETIVRLILNLGIALGLEVVAEGVESTLHRDRLRSFGCTLGQGYLWGAPAPPEAAGRAGVPAGAQATGGV